MKKIAMFVLFIVIAIVGYLLYSNSSTKTKIVKNKIKENTIESNNTSTKVKNVSNPAVLNTQKNTKSKEHNKSSSVKKVNVGKKDSVIKTLDELLAKIKQGVKVEPKVVKKILLDYYAQFDSDADVAITLKLTPLFVFLNDNYTYYKNMILKLYEEKEKHELLRLPMLQIIGNHIQDKESQDTVMEVFMDKDGESKLVLGYSAKVLAKNKIDISKELLKRYSNSSDIEKKFYARSFGYLKTKEALNLIEEDLNNINDVAIKSSLLQSYSSIDPNNEQVINKLEEYKENISEQQGDKIEKEILSVQTIMAMSKSTKPDVYEKIIAIAFDDKQSIHVRAEAIISMFNLPSTVDKAMIINKLHKLKNTLNVSSMNKGDRDFLISYIDEALSNIKRSK